MDIARGDSKRKFGRLIRVMTVFLALLPCRAEAQEKSPSANLIYPSTEQIENVARLHRKADDLIIENKFREAVDVYRQILLIEPDDETAYTNMGNAYWIMGDTDRARDAFENALDINPENEAAAAGIQKIMDPDGQ